MNSKNIGQIPDFLKIPMGFAYIKIEFFTKITENSHLNPKFEKIS